MKVSPRYHYLAILIGCFLIQACNTSGKNNVVKSSKTLTVEYSSTRFSSPVLQLLSTGPATVSGNTIDYCSITPSLPVGLNINQTTCEISGIPTSAVTGTYTITATSSGAKGKVDLILDIIQVIPIINYYSSTIQFNIGASSTTGIATNTGGSISDCIVTPALPTGLSINTTTCEISGTPVVLSATRSYEITALNTAGNAIPRALTIGVLDIAPSITYSSATYSFNLNSPDSTTGIPTNTAFAITGCTVSPSLPTGLSISTTTCAISGTPTVVTAAADYTITPSNAIGLGTTRVINLTIANVPPSIAYSSATYVFSWNTASSSGALTNTGGAITGCRVSPTLPTSLSLSASTCIISGTPTVARAAANYTITPSNSMGDGAARVLSLSVTAPALVTNGAYALYDAASTTSYPAASRYWYDTSGNNRTADACRFTGAGLTTNGGRSVVLGESLNDAGCFRGYGPHTDTTYSIQTWIKFYGFNFFTTLSGTNMGQTLLSLSTYLGPNRAIRSFGSTLVSRIDPGVWYNLAVTVDGSSARTYLNGSLVSSNSNGIAFTGGVVYIGGDSYGSGFSNIGDYLIYSKTLSATEVMQNYQNKFLTHTNTAPTPGTSNYTYATDQNCGNGPSGETVYSAIPAALNTTFYLDSNLTIRSGSSLNVNGVDYSINGRGEAIDASPYCD